MIPCDVFYLTWMDRHSPLTTHNRIYLAENAKDDDATATARSSEENPYD